MPSYLVNCNSVKQAINNTFNLKMSRKPSSTVIFVNTETHRANLIIFQTNLGFAQNIK